MLHDSFTAITLAYTFYSPFFHFCRLRGVTAFAQHCISLCKLPKWSQPSLTGNLMLSVVVLILSYVH